jgi:hypothetical protein
MTSVGVAGASVCARVLRGEARMAAGMVLNRYVGDAEPHSGDPSPFVESDSGRLRVIVVFTTIEGTLAALKSAAKFAQALNAEITLLVTQVVYFRYPLESPPVSADFLCRLCVALIEELKSEELRTDELGLDGDAINIDIQFCREQVPCLEFALKPRSVVVIGARKSWWRKPERKLERALKRRGHDVLLVGDGASDYRARVESVVHRLEELTARGRSR